MKTYDRVASTTAASVRISAAIWPGPSGSPSAAVEETTPSTGTAIVPIAATGDGKEQEPGGRNPRSCGRF
jgi:hypothetical protein